VGAGRYRPRMGSRQAMAPPPMPEPVPVPNNAAALNQAKKNLTYENQTKNIVTKKKGKGFLNDEINFNALLRFLNENVSNTVTNSLKNPFMDKKNLETQLLVGAKDKVGQNRGFLSEMGLNAIENIATGKGSRDDVKSLAYFLGGKTGMNALMTSDATRFLRDKKVPFTNISAADALLPRGVNQAEKLGTAGINKFIDILTTPYSKMLRNK
jgi:hypothetical protein